MEKTINVRLNSASVRSAIRQLKQIKKVIEKDIPIYAMRESLKTISENANSNLDRSNLKFFGTTSIRESWNIDVNPQVGTLTNDDEIATYVEFGTGLVGLGNQHPSAKTSGYNYNVPSASKNESGGWNFIVEYEGEILHFNDFKGYEGKNFLYNACFEFAISGLIQRYYEIAFNKFIK